MYFKYHDHERDEKRCCGRGCCKRSQHHSSYVSWDNHYGLSYRYDGDRGGGGDCCRSCPSRSDTSAYRRGNAPVYIASSGSYDAQGGCGGRNCRKV